jgi:hypothetical protein
MKQGLFVQCDKRLGVLSYVTKCSVICGAGSRDQLALARQKGKRTSTTIAESVAGLMTVCVTFARFWPKGRRPRTCRIKVSKCMQLKTTNAYLASALDIELNNLVTRRDTVKLKRSVRCGKLRDLSCDKRSTLTMTNLGGALGCIHPCSMMSLASKAMVLAERRFLMAIFLLVSSKNK